MTADINYFKIEVLIEEVRNHPQLWCLHHIHYSDKLVKAQTWRNICRKLFPKIEENSPELKARVAYIQKKWKSIRDYYTKQCKEPLIKRQKYIYFESVQFLDNRMAPFPTVEATEEEEEEKVEVEDHSLDLLNNVNKSSAENRTGKGQENSQETPIKTEDEEISEPPTSAPPSFLQTNAMNLDEDELFLLSILPSIRKLTPLQKMDFKLEVMNTLKNIQFSES